MEAAVAALLGVLAGASASAGTALLLLRRAADRDLIERRLRALIQYREILGPAAEMTALQDPAELDQLVRDLGALAREFRLTAWIFDDPFRMELGLKLAGIEDEIRRNGACGERPAAVSVLAAARELDRSMRSAALRCLREHRRWRSWPFRRSGGAGEDAFDLPSHPPTDAGLREEDAAVR